MELHFERITQYMGWIWQGLGITIYITLVALLLAFIIASLLVIFRISKLKILNAFTAVYVSFFRGVPLLVQLFVIYFGVTQLTDYAFAPSAINAGIITFGMNSAAYLSESLRGGIESVEKGQLEAAQALGVGYGMAMTRIVLPQALKVVLPSLINTSIMLLKNSSIVSQIGVLDLMRAGQQIMSYTYLSFEPLIVVAIFYFILVVLLSTLSQHVEKKLTAGD